MSDEIKIEEEKNCNCFCHSKGFRKFLVVAAGTFVGVYLALSLFAASNACTYAYASTLSLSADDVQT